MAHSSLPSAFETLDSLRPQSPHGMSHSTEQSRCCCGRQQCPYLRHNDSAMEGLEKDLRSAAQIGQVSGLPESLAACLYSPCSHTYGPPPPILEDKA